MPLAPRFTLRLASPRAFVAIFRTGAPSEIADALLRAPTLRSGRHPDDIAVLVVPLP